MIAFVHGTLVGKTATEALVDVGGVGYSVGMSQSGIARLPEAGSSVLIHTYLQVREDGVALFGFLSSEEKSFFERLISVSGVGPKVALSALSVFTPDQLANAIAAQDVALVSRIPGIGKKTASRIILELKGSFDAVEGLFTQSAADNIAPSVSSGVKEALLSMGFTDKESELALKDAPQDSTEDALLKFALRKLGSL